jgi:hypothetical protein
MKSACSCRPKFCLQTDTGNVKIFSEIEVVPALCQVNFARLSNIIGINKNAL